MVTVGESERSGLAGARATTHVRIRIADLADLNARRRAEHEPIADVIHRLLNPSKAAQIEVSA